MKRIIVVAKPLKDMLGLWLKLMESGYLWMQPGIYLIKKFLLLMYLKIMETLKVIWCICQIAKLILTMQKKMLYMLKIKKIK